MLFLSTHVRRISRFRVAIRDKNASVNAFVAISDPEPPKGLLQNVAVAVKDNICTKDMPTSCSSAILHDFTSPFDATVVNILRDAGADIVGKTNCDEFGMGSLNAYSNHGPVVNPFQEPSSTVPWFSREKHSAGGSSGGSAAAVAADMCTVALGTDTGGSVRLPASYCGVAGLKPSYGLLSRWGVVSYADSLDCVGILSKNVSEIHRVFKLLNIYDEQDPTSVSPHIRREASDLAHASFQKNSTKGVRIGIPQEYFPAELTSSVLNPVRHIIESLTDQGAICIPVSLPSTPYALSAYYVIASAEASSNLARYDGVQYGSRVSLPLGSDMTKTSTVYAHTRSLGFGEEVKRRMLLGTYSLSADAFDNYFLQALRVRQLVRDDFDRVFRSPNVLTQTRPADDKGVDVLLHPSAIRTAPSLEQPSGAQESGLDAYVQDVMTVPASLAGLPAISVPIHLDNSWPLGLSVVGQWGSDEVVLDMARIIEETVNANSR